MTDDKSLEAAARAVIEAEGAYHHRDNLWMTDGGLVGKEHFSEVARACVQAYLASERAAGRVMVPVEATDEMWRAADKECMRIYHSQHWGWIYAAMVGARPNGEG